MELGVDHVLDDQLAIGVEELRVPRIAPTDLLLDLVELPQSPLPVPPRSIEVFLRGAGAARVREALLDPLEHPVVDHLARLELLGQDLGVVLLEVIVLRLVAITSVALPYFLLQLTDDTKSLTFDFVFRGAAATYAANLVYLILLALRTPGAKVQAYIHLAGDLLLITGLVFYFGGTSSSFSILYLIVITEASVFLRRRAGVHVASFAWLLYASVVYVTAHGWAIGPEQRPGDDAEEDRVDAEALYRLLTDEVVPCYYDRAEDGLPHNWIARMKRAIADLSPRFGTSRMVRDYAERYYLAAAAKPQA